MQSPETGGGGKTGIVIVHGVGHPEKGSTLSEISLGLVGYLNRTGKEAPVEFTDSHIMVGTPTDNCPNNVYEAPVRRFKLNETEVVAAEVFWGDLSQIKSGVFNLLRGLFDLLYGLPAVIRHMIEEAGDSFESRSLAKYGLYIRLAISAILGPVLAMSFLSLVVILLSVVIYALKPVVTDCGVDSCLGFDAGIMLAGMLVMVAATGRIRQWFKQRQWSTMTLIYLFYFSIIASIWMVTALFTDAVSPYAFLNSIPLLLIALWIVSAVCNGLAIFYLFQVKRTAAGSKNSGVTAAFILTELSYSLWAILTTGLFYLSFKVLPENYFKLYLSTVCVDCDVFRFCSTCSINNPNTHFNVDAISWVLLPFLVFFMTVGVFLWARFAPQNSSLDNPRRLIVPDALFRWMLWFTIVIVALFFVFGISLLLGLGFELWLFGGIGFAGQVVIWLLAGVIGLFTIFGKQIRSGLDIGLDITNYWRQDDEVAETRQPPVGMAKVLKETKTGVTRTWVSKLIDIDHVLADFGIFTANVEMPQRAKNDAEGESGKQLKRPGNRFGNDILQYYKRYEMRARFVAVVDAVLAEKPDRLVILSHSQGTMIAIDGLQYRQSIQSDQSTEIRHHKSDANPGSFDNNGRLITHLVTMGSPYQHLYHQYFPQTHQPDPFDGKRPLVSWLNIHRSNDYIGQEIAGPGDHIENKSVGPRGHTGYWRDDEAFGYMVDHLERHGVALR